MMERSSHGNKRPRKSWPKAPATLKIYSPSDTPSPPFPSLSLPSPLASPHVPSRPLPSPQLPTPPRQHLISNRFPCPYSANSPMLERCVSWLLSTKCFTTAATLELCTPRTYAVAKRAPSVGSSPLMYSALRPLRATRCTFTPGLGRHSARHQKCSACIKPSCKHRPDQIIHQIAALGKTSSQLSPSFGRSPLNTPVMEPLVMPSTYHLVLSHAIKPISALYATHPRITLAPFRRNSRPIAAASCEGGAREVGEDGGIFDGR